MDHVLQSVHEDHDYNILHGWSKNIRTLIYVYFDLFNFTFSIFFFDFFDLIFLTILCRFYFLDHSFSIYFSRYFILVIFDLTIYFNTKYNLIYDLNMKILITISFTCSARENCSLQTNCDRAYFNIFCFLSL